MPQLTIGGLGRCLGGGQRPVLSGKLLVIRLGNSLLARLASCAASTACLSCSRRASWTRTKLTVARRFAATSSSAGRHGSEWLCLASIHRSKERRGRLKIPSAPASFSGLPAQDTERMTSGRKNNRIGCRASSKIRASTPLAFSRSKRKRGKRSEMQSQTPASDTQQAGTTLILLSIEGQVHPRLRSMHKRKRSLSTEA